MLISPGNTCTHDPTFNEEVKNGEVQVEGSLEKVQELISLLDTFEFWFNIVTP